VSDNHAGGVGGGILNDGALALRDSTLSDNVADLGGGIYNGGTLTLKDVSFSENLPDDCIGC
jgi:hypothetical protein